MNNRNFRADALLLIVAIIWGLAFAAQRMGMESLGPFSFNALRFALGVLSLLPLLLFMPPQAGTTRGSAFWRGGFYAGLLLFLGSSAQQVGLVWTTAGNAGFITGLYVVLVPILGLFFAQCTGKWTWLGAAFAVIGLSLLSIGPDFSINKGDLWVLLSAGFWAGHVLIIGRLARQLDNLRLAIVQFAVCAGLSAVVAIALESDSLTLTNIHAAALPIAWAGIASVGIAYTLQIFAQRDAPASHAAIIMSLESVFAAVGGALILGEQLDTRGMIGCTLMLCGMLVSQIPLLFQRKKAQTPHHS